MTVEELLTRHVCPHCRRDVYAIGGQSRLMPHTRVKGVRPRCPGSRLPLDLLDRVRAEEADA